MIPEHELRFGLSASVGDAATGAVNHAADVRKVKNRLSELGFLRQSVGERVTARAIAAIRLFQSIVNGHQRVDGSGVDGVVDVDRATHKWLQARNAPRWQLMPLGTKEQGFINCERRDQVDLHDYGVSWMAYQIIAAAKRYLRDYLAYNPGAAPLAVNDVSLPRGGNTPDHKGHETGLACDLRLPRRNGGVGGVTIASSQYDRQAARAMLEAVKSQPLVNRLFFNDPELVAEGLCRSVSGHHNHIHFEIQPPHRRA